MISHIWPPFATELRHSEAASTVLRPLGVFTEELRVMKNIEARVQTLLSAICELPQSSQAGIIQQKTTLARHTTFCHVTRNRRYELETVAIT